MALACQLLNLSMNNGTSNTITSAATAPAANSLLVIATGYRRAGAASAQTPTTAHAGAGTVTLIVNDNGAVDTQSEVGTGAWFSQMGASPGSATSTATWGASVNQQLIAVIEVTGHDPSSPIGSSNSNQVGASAGTAIDVVLSPAPAATSLCIFQAIVNSTASGKGATNGGTELVDVNPTSTTPFWYIQYNNGSAPTTGTRDAIATGNQRTAVYYEIKLAPPPAPTGSPVFVNIIGWF